jgi:hypothetical protein
MDLRKLFIDGQQQLNTQRAALEASRAGILRAGNTGYMVGDSVRGRCPREAIMRYFGIDKDFPLSTRIMFAAGELMENVFIDRFSKSWSGGLGTQQEYPVEWICNGIPVSGSPDLVFTDGNNTPVFGCEFKMISSYWTMHKVTPWKEDVAPKPDHIAQAAHYMYKMGQQIGEDYVEWALGYVCPNAYHIHTPAVRDSDQYRDEFIRKNGRVFKIDPHLVFYYLHVDSSGRVLFRREDSEQLQETEITVQGIERYYELLVECISERKLPPRYENTDCFGRPQKGWSPYEKQYNDYYALHDAYDEGKLSFDEFMDEARKI